MVTARTADDLVSSTPVTFFVEPPGYDLTITSTDLPATPADAIGNIQTTVVNLDDPAIFQTVTYLDLGQSTTIRVPAGRYSVLGSLIDYSPASGHSRMASSATRTCRSAPTKR